MSSILVRVENLFNSGAERLISFKRLEIFVFILKEISSSLNLTTSSFSS